MPEQARSLAREVRKYSLRHILRCLPVATYLPKCCGINQADMPPDQFRESGFRLLPHILPQQLIIVFCHSNM
jgi:hypothetical protein